ncbi:YdhK family protein [Brachybacterium saurashtrense]|uniref:DUF1541 domain-containing protein n=1 Tax=Brachybacterium saurashtrense TaxID=556288 RepID=A0A345YLF4_9MICO|nr:YdhK family protein [Brachybacterium saurashtrense]AXK44756.1 DUF1541 domain-containing protein [Brachybacterium saurashtrense]RRR23368.1 DUF1541 domain-containing protein [Brachybacterium saurashtrense]
MRVHRTPARLAAAAALGALALAGCTGADPEEPGTDSSAHGGAASDDGGAAASDGGGQASDHMDHPMDGGPAPADIAEESDPTYPVGSEVMLTADHMQGMDGAAATISGAFDTTTYSISYTPSDGGDPVTDHRWVVQEELRDPADAPLEVGDEVVVEASHMPGMEGATATVDSVTEETVYMVDYEADGMEMTNHKWVVESEIEPAD